MTNDTIRMQQEAALRVQRMQEHARQVVNPERQRERTPETLAAAKPTPRPPAPPSKKTVSAAGLSAILNDPERLLLLLLALLLLNSNANVEIIVAVLYLALG